MLTISHRPPCPSFLFSLVLSLSLPQSLSSRLSLIHSSGLRLDAKAKVVGKEGTWIEEVNYTPLRRERELLSLLASHKLEGPALITSFRFLQLISSLGVVLFKALDYGYDEHEERQLRPDLDSLIGRLTTADECGRDSCDEGIERDSGEDEGSLEAGGLTMDRVVEVRLSSYSISMRESLLFFFVTLRCLFPRVGPLIYIYSWNVIAD